MPLPAAPLNLSMTPLPALCAAAVGPVFQPANDPAAGPAVPILLPNMPPNMSPILLPRPPLNNPPPAPNTAIAPKLVANVAMVAVIPNITFLKLSMAACKLFMAIIFFASDVKGSAFPASLSPVFILVAVSSNFASGPASSALLTANLLPSMPNASMAGNNAFIFLLNASVSLPPLVPRIACSRSSSALNCD